MRASILPVLLLSACWPYLPGPYEDYVDGDSDTADVDTADGDTADVDTSDVDTDTDADTEPACVDDSREDDDDFASATPIVDGSRISGTICPGDIDVMRLDMDADCEASLTLGFVHAQGDLDLYVYEGNTEVASSTSLTNDEALTVASTGSPLAVLINGFEGASNAYTLLVDITCDPDVDTDTEPDTDPDTDPDTEPPGCIDDGFEPNDNQLSPELLGTLPDSLTGQICAGDDDWYEFQTRVGCAIRAELDFSHSATTDLEMSLHPEDGAATASAQSSSDNELLQVSSAPTATMQLRVWGYQNSESPYDLTITEDCSAIEPDCVDDAIESSETESSPYPVGAAPILRSLQMCGPDTDTLVMEVPDPACDVTTSITHFDDLDVSLDLRLLDDGGVYRSATTLDGFATITAPATGTEAVIQVRSLSEANSVAYTVTGYVDCPDTCSSAFEPNDLQTTAHEVTLPFTASAGICPANDDDFYTFQTAIGCTVDASIAFSHSVGDLDIRLYRSDETVGTASSTSTNDVESIRVVADTTEYDLKVYGYSTAEGPYDITITETCPDCQLDTYEPSSNTTPHDFESLPVDTTATLCTDTGDDGDVYTFQADAGCDITAQVTAPVGTELFGYLEDVDGTLDQMLDTNAFTLTATARNSGTHTLDLGSLDAGELTYDLFIDVTCDSTDACVPDEWEENDVREDAVYTLPDRFWDPTTCDGDTDWWSMDFQDGCKLGIEVSTAPGAPTVDATLYNGTSTRGSVTDGPTGRSIVYSPRSTGIVELEVLGTESTAYSIISDQYGCAAHPCGADAFEPNESLVQATEVPLGGSHIGTACIGDVDVWKTRTPEVSCPVLVDVDSGPVLDVSLLDDNGDPVFTIDSTDSLRYLARNEALSISGGAGATYRVRAEDACSVVPTCPGDDLLSPIPSATQSGFLPWGTSGTLAACATDDWFAVVPPTCNAVVQVTPRGDAVVRAAFVDASGEPLGAMVPVGNGSSDFVSSGQTGAFVRVTAESGNTGAYDIAAFLECD